ncbi:Aminobenzoyl-glutamate utilization protein B [Mycobacteroides abscessus subsp. abscessus]|nr:Aminobenzoyl-glutamate utilization protein B [Mycobacteroides abscessus subsp. abscessus]
MNLPENISQIPYLRMMLRAAEALALTSIRLLTEKEELKKVQQEFALFRDGNPYTCPIPEGVNPSKLSEGSS